MEKNQLFSEEKLNLKEEYKKSAGKKVATDFFIYSCMAEDHTLQTLGAGVEEAIRWPVLAARRETGKLDDPLPEKPLEECLHLLISWYGTNYPELASHKPLDHALCSQLVGKFILMINDIRQLVFIKLGKGLPQIPVNEARPELWITLESYFKEIFSTYAPYLMSYFQWVYAKPVERKFELPDLPPVGRYFGILKDNLRSRGERSDNSEESSSTSTTHPPTTPLAAPIVERESIAKRSDNENEREPRERTPREPREPREAREPREPREPRERMSRPERSPRPEREHRHDRGDRDRSDRDEDKGKKDKERLALLEVDKAVLAMKKHSSMNEFRLRPQNSFIRRLQHKKVNGLGFKSHSVGEDDDRAVLITRED